jgi:hypothetical protein
VLRRGVGSPSTWDLNRFELLAQEVLSCLPTADNGAEPSARPLPDSSDPSSAQPDGRAPVPWQSRLDQNSSSQAAQTSAASEPQPSSDGSVGSSNGVSADNGAGFPFTLVAALNAVLYQRQGYKRMARHGTPQ